MCGFIAQLVEHHTGIAEVTGSNPIEALIFFRLLLSDCDDHSSLSFELCFVGSQKLKICYIVFSFFLAAGDINAPASAQANKTFLPWETHLFTRLLKYGKQSKSELFLNVISGK